MKGVQHLLIFQWCMQIFARNFTQLLNNKIYTLPPSFVEIWFIWKLHNYVVSIFLFTALHAMQTRSSDENSVCLSVRLSVCLSVTRMNCDKTVERYVQIYIPYERTFSLVFWEEEWLVGDDDPFHLKFWINQHPLAQNHRFWTDNRL